MVIEKSKVPALTRAAKILDIIAEKGPLQIAEIQNFTQIPHSSCYNIIDELIKLGLIRQNKEGKVSLWVKMIYLGKCASSSLDLSDVVLPHILDLLSRYDCIHVQFGALYQGKAYYLLKRSNPKATFHAMAREGMEMSLVQAGLGKLLLAYQDKNFINKILPTLDYTPVTPTSITTPEQLVSELNKIRKQGWALGNEEGEIGFRSISAPVFNDQLELIGGISIVGSVYKFTDAILQDISQSVIKCANAISKSISYSH